MPRDLLTECRDILEGLGIEGRVVDTALLTLRQRCGGDRCYVPKVDREYRVSKVRTALGSGAPIQVAARRAGCTVRTVQRLQKEWNL